MESTKNKNTLQKMKNNSNKLQIELVKQKKKTEKLMKEISVCQNKIFFLKTIEKLKRVSKRGGDENI